MVHTAFGQSRVQCTVFAHTVQHCISPLPIEHLRAPTLQYRRKSLSTRSLCPSKGSISGNTPTSPGRPSDQWLMSHHEWEIQAMPISKSAAMESCYVTFTARQTPTSKHSATLATTRRVNLSILLASTPIEMSVPSNSCGATSEILQLTTRVSRSGRR